MGLLLIFSLTLFAWAGYVGYAALQKQFGVPTLLGIPGLAFAVLFAMSLHQYAFNDLALAMIVSDANTIPKITLGSVFMFLGFALGWLLLSIAIARLFRSLGEENATAEKYVIVHDVLPPSKRETQ